MVEHRHTRFVSSITHALRVLQSSMPKTEITSEVLEVLARAASCEWATYWQVDSSQHVLRPAAAWSVLSVHSSELERDTSTRMLTLSEGNAGHVWRSRKPIWTTDLVRDMCLPRSLDAKKAGLAGGIWFSVKTDDAVYGVIELLGRQLECPSEALLVEIEHLGIQLGTLLEAAHQQNTATGR